MTQADVDAIAAEIAADVAPWWRSGVVYQIYPRSFAGSNRVGVGDLDGTPVQVVTDSKTVPRG